MSNAIEIVTFNLNATATKEQVLATTPIMQVFLNQQPGFLYRSLSCDEQGLWFDIVYWENQQAAQAGGEAFMKSAAGAALMPLIDAASCKMRHMDALSAVLADSLAA
ncbi:MAG: hypothetical protein V7784_12235 [Oceanospirillaceae bacterium]